MSLSLLAIGLAMASVDVTPADIAGLPAPAYVNVALLSDEDTEDESDDESMDRADEEAHEEEQAADWLGQPDEQPVEEHPE